MDSWNSWYLRNNFLIPLCFFSDTFNIYYFLLPLWHYSHFSTLLQTLLGCLTYTSQVPPHNVTMTSKPVSPVQISESQSCISYHLWDVSTYAMTYVQNQTQDPDPTNLVFPKSVDGTNVVTQARNLKCHWWPVFPSSITREYWSSSKHDSNPSFPFISST